MGTMRRLMLATAIAAVPMAVAADCAPPDADPATGTTVPKPPSPPDPDLIPALPECLSGLAAPNQENCTSEEIAAYGSAIEAYQKALRAYVADADGYANDAVREANEAVARARAAQDYADRVFDYANCEADRLRAQN